MTSENSKKPDPNSMGTWFVHHVPVWLMNDLDRLCRKFFRRENGKYRRRDALKYFLEHLRQKERECEMMKNGQDRSNNNGPDIPG